MADTEEQDASRDYEVAFGAAVEQRGSKRQRRFFKRSPQTRRLAALIARDEYETAVTAGEVTASEGDTPILDFLKWLIESGNLERIIKLIMDLFLPVP